MPFIFISGFTESILILESFCAKIFELLFFKEIFLSELIIILGNETKINI